MGVETRSPTRRDHQLHTRNGLVCISSIFVFHLFLIISIRVIANGIIQVIMDIRISLGLLLALATLSYGMKCQVCNSHDDETCADPYTGSHLKDCAEGEFCRKIYQNIRGEKSYIRSCGSEVTEKYKLGDCYTTVLEEYNTEVCTCNNEEGCNGSTSVSPASIFSMTLMAAVAAYINRQ